MSFRVGEYGGTLYFSLGYNISAASTIVFDLTKPDGSVLTISAVLGSQDVINTPLGTLPANKWASYDFLAGELDQAGTWTAQATVTWTSPAKRLKSPPLPLEVAT